MKTVDIHIRDIIELAKIGSRTVQKNSEDGGSVSWIGYLPTTRDIQMFHNCMKGTVIEDTWFEIEC